MRTTGTKTVKVAHMEETGREGVWHAPQKWREKKLKETGKKKKRKKEREGGRKKGRKDTRAQ